MESQGLAHEEERKQIHQPCKIIYNSKLQKQLAVLN